MIRPACDVALAPARQLATISVCWQGLSIYEVQPAPQRAFQCSWLICLLIPAPAWLPVSRLQVAMTATVVSEAILFMPVREPDAAVVKLHESLQRFAW